MSYIPFAASVISPETGSTDAQALNNCSSVILTDDSNYLACTEPGHLAANFVNYRTFTLTHYSGTIYPLSSVSVPPTCTAAYNGSNPNIPLTTGDGWYLYALSTVPTWSNAGVGYLANSQQVYNVQDGNIYTCIQNNTSSALNRPDLAPAFWQLVPAASLPAGLISKYTASGYFALICGALTCLPALVSKALCQTDGCNTLNLSTNLDFTNALLAYLCMYGIQTAQSQGQLAMTSNIFDTLNSLCNCN